MEKQESKREAEETVEAKRTDGEEMVESETREREEGEDKDLEGEEESESEECERVNGVRVITMDDRPDAQQDNDKDKDFKYQVCEPERQGDNEVEDFEWQVCGLFPISKAEEEEDVAAAATNEELGGEPAADGVE